VLKKIGKKISIDQATHAVDACRRAGMRTMCTFIAGFPFDTRETMRMTLEAAVRIGPTIALFFPLTPYPGTEVYDKFLDNTLIPGDVASWNHYIVTSDTAGISVNPDFSGQELRHVVARWNKKYYFRPVQILRMLRSVSGLEDFMRLARGGIYLLSTLFRRKG
jgi:radical SAM superfamily enzyme